MPAPNLIFVDCEAYGPAPGVGQLTEFGAVEYVSRKTFHGVLVSSYPDPNNPVCLLPIGPTDPQLAFEVMSEFAVWLQAFGGGRSIMVSDNIAYDYQWINYEFGQAGIPNPFGHSGRRISDFYAGLRGDFFRTQEWKRLRITPHDHNPVNDAMGNVEAFERIMKGER